MPRPRVLDLSQLMDMAERLAAESGPRAVTIRALSDATSISNGAIYHAFGSRAGLLGHVWLRAAKRYLCVQRAAVAQALSSGTAREPVVDAVVAAARCPATFFSQDPVSARFLLAVHRDNLFESGDLPGELADDLRRLDHELGGLLIELSERMWNRRDRCAVAAIRACVVELPTALVIRGQQPPDSAALQRLDVAVRAVLTLTPPIKASTKKKQGAHHDRDG